MKFRDREIAREMKFPDRESREIGKFLFTSLELLFLPNEKLLADPDLHDTQILI